MCNLWQNYFSDLVYVKSKQCNFNHNFIRFIDKTVENVDSNLKWNEISFTKQNAKTSDEIKRLIKKISKGKAPWQGFFTNKDLIQCGYTRILK